MGMGSLGVVEEWLTAVNRGDGRRAMELTAEDVEVTGPRGTARGREVLAGWMTRAGFSADPLRWFCGADGAVVVEQDARWVDLVSGAERGSARVASQFTVQKAVVARYQRHDSLDRALAEAGLTRDDEVTHRQMRR